MRVIPVIDLMRGQVVRGVGGRRDEYRPIESVLAADASPASVAEAFCTAGFRETYVADLDAIGGLSPAWSTYRELMRPGLELWVDAGVASVEAARELAAFECDGRPLAAIVAGLETLRGPRELAAIGALCGWQRLIFSLDLKHGVPLFGSPEWRGLDARQIAATALRRSAADDRARPDSRRPGARRG